MKKYINHMNHTVIEKDRWYPLWSKAMRWGEHSGCHQKPERSLFIRGYQFPICTRCLGVYIGYMVAIPIFLMVGFEKLWKISLAGAFSMLADWMHQAISHKESTHVRRLITGIAGGFGLMIFYIKGIYMLIQYLKK